MRLPTRDRPAADTHTHDAHAHTHGRPHTATHKVAEPPGAASARSNAPAGEPPRGSASFGRRPAPRKKRRAHKVGAIHHAEELVAEVREEGAEPARQRRRVELLDEDRARVRARASRARAAAARARTPLPAPCITQENSSLRSERKVSSPRADADAPSCSKKIVPVCSRAPVVPVCSRAPVEPVCSRAPAAKRRCRRCGCAKRAPRKTELLEAEPSPASPILLVISLAWPRARCSAISRLRLEK